MFEAIKMNQIYSIKFESDQYFISRKKYLIEAIFNYLISQNII